MMEEFLDWSKSFLLKQLLSFEQVLFINDVMKVICAEHSVKHCAPSWQEVKFRSIARQMEVDLKALIIMLKKNESSAHQFLNLYPKWKSCRNASIKQLNIIANEMDADKKKFQEDKLAENFMSIVGAGITLVTGGILLPLVGVAVSGLSALSAADTAVKEEEKLKEKIKETKEVLEHDYDSQQALIKWLKETTSLHNALTACQKDIASFQEEANRSHANCSRILEKAEKDILNIFKRRLPKTETDKEIQKIIRSLPIPGALKEEFAKIFGILLSFKMLFEKYRDPFEIVKSNHSILEKANFAGAVSVFSAGVQCVSTIKNIKNGVLLKSISKKVLVLNVISFLVTANQEPTSAEAKDIRNIIADMKTEAKEFESLHGQVRLLAHSYSHKAPVEQGLSAYSQKLPAQW